MTSYRTCTNCAVASAPCARRDEVRSAIKGAGITAVKFRCHDRQSLFQPGQRVSVTWPVGGDRDEMDLESWSATVISEVGSRFLISIDDADGDLETPARDYIKNERLFAKVSLAKLRVLDEPMRAICGWCTRAPGPGEACQETGWDTGAPGCLVAKQLTGEPA